MTFYNRALEVVQKHRVYRKLNLDLHSGEFHCLGCDWVGNKPGCDDEHLVTEIDKVVDG